MTTIEKGKKYVANTYSRQEVAFVRGEGCCLFDEDGKRYIDFAAGFAVNGLGYGDKDLARAVYLAASQLIHVSNLFYTRPQTDIAEKLCKAGGFAKAFFCNSGAEAVESCIKLMKKAGFSENENESRYEIIAARNSFHGRTTAALSVTGNEHYRHGFTPLLPGVVFVDYNDVDAIKAAVTNKTCGVILETVQGEGGMLPAQKAYLEAVQALCDERGLVLAFDEVQCGMGRTGKLFAWQNYGVSPDVMAISKFLAGGIPMGAMLINEKYADALKPGEHASTFGGNPLAATCANLVFDKLTNGLIDNAAHMGDYFIDKLKSLALRHSGIVDVRGLGLMIGAEFDGAYPIAAECLKRGLLVVNAGANVIRFTPPLIIDEKIADEGLEIFAEVLCAINN